MVKNLGVGIAEAQLELDLVSLRIAQIMAGQDPGNETTDGQTAENPYRVEFTDGKKYSLLELGFTPTFYQFVDTVIELKMSISTQPKRKVKTIPTKVQKRNAGG
ncbi:MAG: hypothetical protein LRY63_02120, partial [Nitrincola sp.]|nr:hypothetical protein [Nitrincola sp.]